MTILPFAILLGLLVSPTATVRPPVTPESARGFPPDSLPVASAARVHQLDPGLRTADSLVSLWVGAERVPGAVLLVTEDGRPVLEKAYGWAQLYDYGDGQYGDWSGGSDVGRNLAFQPDSAVSPGIRRLAEPVPVTTATVFDMASVTKVMATTFAVMMLVDEGKLDLDAPLYTYLPDFRGGGKDDITARLLLTHRSGLYPWQPIFYHASDERGAYAYIRDLPLAWKPGAERHYSDLGFMLLGLIVERISGQPLDVFVRDRLYRPLGLEHTGFRRTERGDGAPGSATASSRSVAPGGPERSATAASTGAFAATSHGNPYEYRMVHDSTFGYRYEDDPNAWNGWRHHTLAGEVNDGNSFHAFNGVAGHAGLFSTAEDLSVLLRLLLEGGEYDGRRYVSRKVVDAFMTPTGDGQALGWQVPGYAPAGSFDHTGFTGTFVLGVPARGLAVVLLTNRQNVGVSSRTLYPDVGPLQRAVAAALLRPPPSSSR
ncbi:MAG: serine hydrolase [Gemmatimonadetes bacterium]|nr:serine hydrolase [Gemmatimonadota bacterium]